MLHQGNFIYTTLLQCFHLDEQLIMGRGEYIGTETSFEIRWCLNEMKFSEGLVTMYAA